MKKILIVDFNGTSSIYTHYLANGLKNSEIDVDILGKKRLDFLDVFSKTNNYLGLKTGFKIIDYFINWLWLLINYRKYDAIIIQWLQLLKYFNLENILISYLQSKTTLVYIVHNLYPHNCKSVKVKNRYNKLYSNLNNIAVQTKGIEKEIRRINSRLKIIKFEHGLFFKDFRPNQPDRNLKSCLLIGYISKYKGVEDAIQTVKKLKDNDVYVSLEIIGSGNHDYVKILNKLISSYEIEDRVSILSKEVSTKFLIEKVKSANMLWLPYKNISQSGVAYTAMGLGVPIVVYDVGNFKECFVENGFGELAKRGSIVEFSEGVKKVKINNIWYRKNIYEKLTEDAWAKNRLILWELL